MNHLALTPLMLLADVTPPPIIGSSDGSIIAVLLTAGALVLVGVRLWRKKK